MYNALQMLEHYAGVIHILATIPIFWTWYEIVIVRRRREKDWLRRTKANPGGRPAALAVSLTHGPDISASVEHFLLSTPALKPILEDKRFFTFDLGHKALTGKEWDELAEKLNRKSSEIISSGADVLHVFCTAPMPAAMLVGAIFANRGDVRVYHRTSGGESAAPNVPAPAYVQWGMLNAHINRESILRQLDT